ncbi:CpsD/CapB family tyrosine-protein kinase [Vibrio sp. CAU 1672]|uniref:CpsD/CapB family tyrosine-protein kinase n=1 Tax=Vibrio sp. CAU 1672 TaxID=3032594 RepID=UPI0023DA442D|nr:CpsD/CapB family tyrosine-protein kinase [Vibrio sp. CAU 1672]MDF2152162.1 CpsD/CapB family tyrosine-protein kinase [Vibrio sp. CAU 1672]
MTIPATHSEIEQIYLNIQTNGFHSVCVVGCQSEDGVTSIASSLAERFVLAGYKTLYVDLNLFRPAYLSVHQFEQSDMIGELLQRPQHGQVLLGLPAPTQTCASLVYRDPNGMRQQIAHWRDQYDRIVIDTSPLLNINKSNIPAQVVAGACDATILVACFAQTTATQLLQAKQLLDASNTNLIGAVLNMKQTPSLKDELIRQVNKLKVLPTGWKHKLKQQILRSEWLTH